MELVVNSWLAYYFKPNESEANKKLLALFLEKFLQKDDILVILQEGEMNNRLGLIAKQLTGFPKHYKVLKEFYRQIYSNSLRCKIVTGEPKLPDILENALSKDGTNYRSDRFLFITASHTKDKVIITTDNRLIREGLKDILVDIDFKIYPLKEFLENY